MKLAYALGVVKEVPKTWNRLHESQMLSSAFTKYAVARTVTALAVLGHSNVCYLLILGKLKPLKIYSSDLHRSVYKLDNWHKLVLF